jgi:hypothetical protein
MAHPLALARSLPSRDGHRTNRCCVGSRPSALAYRADLVMTADMLKEREIWHYQEIYRPPQPLSASCPEDTAFVRKPQHVR